MRFMAFRKRLVSYIIRGFLSVDDKEIISMFWNRDESAIKNLQKEYGDELKRLSLRILGNMEDAEECMNDTFLKVWNSIPDEKPDFLFSYCAKIARNLSINKLREETAVKRGRNYIKVLLSELEDCASDLETVESIVGYHELSNLISQFLSTLKQEQRVMFVKRYWYAEKIQTIARSHNCSIKKVESVLLRTRCNLKKYFLPEGLQYVLLCAYFLGEHLISRQPIYLIM